MKFKNNLIRTVISLALAVSIGTTVYAEPTIDSLNKQKQELENQKNQYNQGVQQNQLSADSAQKEINKITSQIYMLDSKIENLNRTIDDTKKKIASKEEDIKVSQKNLDNAQEDIKKTQDLFDKRMRAMYVGGGIDQYLSVLLSSKSLNDLYTKAQAVVAITNYDKKIISILNDKKEAIRVAKEGLQKDRDALLAYKQENEKTLAEVQSAMQEQKRLVAEAKSKKAYYMSQITEYKNKIAAADKQVQDTIKQMQAIAEAEAKKKQQDPNIPVASNAIVAYAYKFLGCPYVWGAAGGIFTQSDINRYRGTSHDLTGMEKYLGRQAFDCSGLMQYVYAHFGIYIGRTTYDQIYDGKAVNRSDLKPGDLVFFGTYSDPHHVGMYVGNNCYIEAPYSGEVVRVSSLDDSDEYLCARRIIN